MCRRRHHSSRRHHQQVVGRVVAAQAAVQQVQAVAASRTHLVRVAAQRVGLSSRVAAALRPPGQRTVAPAIR